MTTKKVSFCWVEPSNFLQGTAVQRHDHRAMQGSGLHVISASNLLLSSEFLPKDSARIAGASFNDSPKFGDLETTRSNVRRPI
jgi:hypothetical protein